MPDTPFPTVRHAPDVCVVGGGMAGLCAAVAAARHGARVVLMQDRPVLGGNASSEIRMWICGAHAPDHKETGLLEEIQLDNYRRNPGLCYPLWDVVLYEKAVAEPRLTLLLNCACCEVGVEAGRLAWVRGWQPSAQTWHEVRAPLFADCSGDSVLRACGAEFRRGREGRAEFHESHAPETADDRTMGNSILLQVREVERHVPFVPPPWAERFTEADLPHRGTLQPGGNFWWLETGGTRDTIRDAEAIRHELLGVALGVWDLVKNHPDGRGHRWELEWIGAVPGKRENIRYVGDHILTQTDLEAEGRFDDLVAYGGWSMDDHHPDAIRHRGPPTIFHPAPCPYGIPYRALYSRNIENLLFAGRNISATHMAMSSTRLMGTCAMLGQAAGTAAALAIRHGCSPRAVGQMHLRELQHALMDDDCYLPWHTRPIPEPSRAGRLTASEGDPEPLRNGMDRALGGTDNGWRGRAGSSWVEYRWSEPVRLDRARLVFDSDLGDTKRMPCCYPLKGHAARFHPGLTRAFDLEVLDDSGRWTVVHRTADNHQRLVRVPLRVRTRGVRFVPRESWGAEPVHLFAFDVR